MNREVDNVYGVITAEQGVRHVLRAVEHLFAGGRTSVNRSSDHGAETLRLRSDQAEFESEPLADGVQHLFNGTVGGPLEQVLGFVRSLSEALRTAGIEHRFEVYDENQDLAQDIP